jgi:hypothetical protein
MALNRLATPNTLNLLQTTRPFKMEILPNLSRGGFAIGNIQFMLSHTQYRQSLLVQPLLFGLLNDEKRKTRERGSV